MWLSTSLYRQKGIRRVKEMAFNYEMYRKMVAEDRKVTERMEK